jgi:predicted MPP superfamily phosphohydrolase
MKTIIISDLHNRVDWVESTLSSLNYDRVVFLGDYFDDFNDTLRDTEKSAKWLKQSLYKPNRIHLLGTHDMWYMCQNEFLRASGNTEQKSEIIDEIISVEDWKLLKLFHYEQEFYMTHAGIHTYIINDHISKHKKLVWRL